MKRFKNGLLVIFLQFSLVLNLSGQTISGTVVSETNEPLAGTTISIPHTNIGTVTDQNGYYSITIDSIYNTLQYCFVGFECQEVAINKDTIVNVTLEESPIELKEIIINALYTHVKKRLTAPVVIKRNGLFRKRDTLMAGGLPDSAFKQKEAERRTRILDSLNVNSHKLNDSINFMENLLPVEREFRKYVIDSVEYPGIALYNAIEGIVYVQFTFNDDSRISDIKILRGVEPVLDDEVISVIKQMPDHIQMEFGKYDNFLNRQIHNKFIARIRFKLIEI